MGILADDTRLWSVNNGDADTQALQNELQKVYELADLNNNATFNSDKF